MSASASRFSTALTKPRRSHRGLYLGIAGGMIVAFGGTMMFTGIGQYFAHRYFGSVDLSGQSAHLKVGAPSHYDDATPTPAPIPAAPSSKQIEKLLRQAQQQAVTPPSEHHDLDAFGREKDKKEESTGLRHETAPGTPPAKSDIAAAAFGGKSTPLDLPGARATVIADRSRTLRPGTRISCGLENRIDTTVGDGELSCVVKSDVWSWDGTVVLLPAGTQIEGVYQALQQGRDRIFAVSAYATGDDGLVVPLGNSKITDPEGAMGMPAEVISNWWPRLRTGLVLDAVQTTTGLIPLLFSHGNNNTYLNLNTGGTDTAVGDALRRDANIPDVGKLNQGTVISMKITEPIYFQDAIRLVMRAGH